MKMSRIVKDKRYGKYFYRCTFNDNYVFLHVEPEDPVRWEEKCTCGAISTAGYITHFTHNKSCPLHELGALNWYKQKSYTSKI